MSFELGPTGPTYLGQPFTQAVHDVLDERVRQRHVKGFSNAHDDRHNSGDLTRAAVSYGTHAVVRMQLAARGLSEDRIGAKAAGATAPSVWPWALTWWRPTTLRRCLVKAAALLIAEIERLDRVAEKERR